MFYENFILKMSHAIAKESGKEQEVIAYGLRIALSSILGYTVLMIISLVLGIFKYAIIAAVTTSIFRIFSGGAHASSQFRCCMSGVLIFVPLGFIVKLYSSGFDYTYLVYITFLVFVLSLLIIYKYVPADTPGKPISSQMQKKRLRIISYTLAVVWILAAFYFLQYQDYHKIIFSSVLGLLWQLYTLTPLGYKIVAKFDLLFKKIGDNLKEVILK